MTAAPPSWRELGALLGAAVALRSYFKGDRGTAAAAALGSAYCVWKMHQAGELSRRLQDAQQLTQPAPTRARVTATAGDRAPAYDSPFQTTDQPGGVNLS